MTAGIRSALAARAEKEIDLVFLDVQMPDMDGFEVVEAHGPERMPAVIFVTAFDEYAVRVRVGGRLRAGRRELLVRANAPLFAHGDADVDAWFPDNLTAVVRLRSGGVAHGTLSPELAAAGGV